MLKVVGASWEQTRVSSYILAAFTILGLVIIIFSRDIGRLEDDGNYAATVTWQEDVGYSVQYWGQGNVLADVPLGTARGYYRMDIATTGWSKLEIETNPDYSDCIQAYSAGLLEGSLTWQLVYWRWKNTIGAACETEMLKCENIRKKLNVWGERMRSTASRQSELDPFWHQINMFYAQLEGLERGWNYAAKRNRHHSDISSEDFLWLNLIGTDVPLPDKASLTPRAPSLTSALLRLNQRANTSVHEVLAAQATASPYRDMLRIVKRYVFPFRMTNNAGMVLAPGAVLTFTGYPGALTSQDDIYSITSRNGSKHSLLVIGSTIGSGLVVSDGNKRSRLKRSTDEMVPGSFRGLAASRLARDSQTWTQYFTRGSGGATVAKQWSILDLAKVDNPEAKGMFWVVEQSRNELVSSDRTQQLRTERYWASYGLPFHPEIRQAFNLPEDNIYSYSEAPRGQVFSRCRFNCTTREEMYHLIRHAVPAFEDLIGARADLYRNEPQPFGVIDTKIITASRDSVPKFEVTAGPVHAANTSAAEVPPVGTVSPFQWSTSAFFDVPHVGHPDIWSFPPNVLEWAGY